MQLAAWVVDDGRGAVVCAGDAAAELVGATCAAGDFGDDGAFNAEGGAAELVNVAGVVDFGELGALDAVSAAAAVSALDVAVVLVFALVLCETPACAAGAADPESAD